MWTMNLKHKRTKQGRGEGVERLAFLSSDEHYRNVIFEELQMENDNIG